MPRTEEANKRIREAQRAKILDAARKTFAHKGKVATMADVATTAGVSQGLAYRYFANKEALLQALVEQAIQSGPTGIKRMLEVPGTPGERLDILVSRLAERRRGHPEIFQILDQMIGDETTPGDLRGLLREQYQALLDVLRQLIVEGQASGEVAEGDPDQLITAILACLGLTRSALRYPERFNAHFPDTEIILRILKPPTDQKRGQGQATTAPMDNDGPDDYNP